MESAKVLEKARLPSHHISAADAEERYENDAARNLHSHLVKALARLLVLLTADLVTITFCWFLVDRLGGGMLGETVARLVAALLSVSTWSGIELGVAIVVGMLFVGAYRGGERWNDPILVLSAIGIGVVLTLYDSLWMGRPLHVLVQGTVVWLGVGLAVAFERWSLGQMIRRLPKRGIEHRVLEIRGDESPAGTVDLGTGYQTLASFDRSDLPASLEDMAPWLEGGVDTMLVTGTLAADEFERLADFALTHGCRLLCAPRACQLTGVDPKRIWIAGQPFSELTAPGLRASQLVIKRAVDVVGSFLLLLLLSPLLTVVAIAVKLDSPGPVLFCQNRAGRRGRFFRLFKFRSMRADAENVLMENLDLYRRYVANDFKLPGDEDPRLTRLGRLLRRTSLDELPQLFNVLRGDMSLVGPRPVVAPELEMYRGHVPILLSVKPGITGPWQISGRSRVPFPHRAELDLDYVRNWSLLRDLWIVLRTIPAVVFQHGAH